MTAERPTRPLLFRARPGKPLLRAPAADRRAEEDEEERASPAEKIVQLTSVLFTWARGWDDEPYLIPITGAHVAQPLRSAATRAALAHAYHQIFGEPPGTSALAAAILVLEGACRTAPRRELSLRVAEHAGGGVVLDLGQYDGQVVHIDESGWRVLDRSPIPLRRTRLTGELPIPERG